MVFMLIYSYMEDDQMQNFKSIAISYLLPVVAVSTVAVTNQQANNKNYLCKQQYALCTSALCIPQPDDPTKAVCFCDVNEGPSVATVECDTIAPSTNENGIRTVYSTFSLEQFSEGKKGMKCPSNTPWTWCLNKRCTVDPTNSRKAICRCDVMRNTGEWMTLGGDCDTSTCQTGYWSGAKMSDFENGIAFLLKSMGSDKSPVKWCPAD